MRGPSTPQTAASTTSATATADSAAASPAATPPPPEIAQLARLTKAGDHEAALALIDTHLSSYQDNTAFLRQARASAAKAGQISLQRHIGQLQLHLTPEHPPLLATNAELEGRWRELDPAYIPAISPEVEAELPTAADYQPMPGRILHVLKISMPHRQSGYSVRTMYSLTGLAQVGYDPVAVTALDFPAGIGITDAPESEEVGGVRHRRLLRETIPTKQPWSDYLDDWASALAPVVAQERPQIIHVHSGHRGYESALVALAVGARLGVPVVYEVRGFFEALWTSDLAWAERGEIYRLRWATETRVMNAAAAVVTLSESMRQDIIERGVDAAKVSVVPNGVNADSFAPRERDAELTAELGLTDRFVFGYVSNLDHYREGQELLIDAAVELNRRGVPATALIVGDGSRREFLEQHAKQVHAGESVVFTGKVPHDRVNDYYAQYDVFVIPRVDERAARLVTPLKPFEAMAGRIPLLVSDLPALQEITGHGERGATFRTGDAVDLADVLQALADDPERRARIALAGQEWVVAERQWSSNGPRYDAVYQGVVAAPELAPELSEAEPPQSQS